MRLIRRRAWMFCATAAVGLLPAAWAADAKPAARPEPPASAPAWVKESARGIKPTEPGDRPIGAVDHVVVISIDGARPDLLLRGDAPNLRKLYRKGAFSFWARTTPNAITLPSHTSMLTGVNPRKHGIEWNRDLPLSEPVYPGAPTAFYHAKRHGYRTGMAAGKSKFDFLMVPGTLDAEWVPEKTVKDTDVADAAAKIILADKPDLMFVHLAGVDTAGHAFGWGSEKQMQALANADEAVGQVIAAVEEAGLGGRTVYIVSADHGGAGRNHGPDDARSRHIPWIASGPGVKQGRDLTTDAELEVNTEDTFATALWLLGIPLDPKIDGKPVKAAFDVPADPPAELLKDAPAAKPAAEPAAKTEKAANTTKDR